jgi:predicted metal-dependent RNase
LGEEIFASSEMRKDFVDNIAESLHRQMLFAKKILGKGGSQRVGRSSTYVAGGKVSQCENTQQTGLAASTVAYDDKFPAENQ